MLIANASPLSFRRFRLAAPELAFSFSFSLFAAALSVFVIVFFESCIVNVCFPPRFH